MEASATSEFCKLLSIKRVSVDRFDDCRREVGLGCCLRKIGRVKLGIDPEFLLIGESTSAKKGIGELLLLPAPE